MKIQTIVNGKLSDLNVIFFGREDPSDHTLSHTTFCKRNDTMIHYVRSGKGYLEFENKKYKLSEGDSFVVTPGVPYRYYYDENDPWAVSWVAFNGKLCNDFKKIDPVFRISPEIFREIDEAHYIKGRKDILLGSLLMRIYFELMEEEETEKNERVSLVKSFINDNYMLPITVDSIAQMLHIHRSHLQKIFLRETGMSVRQYIIHIRLSKAREFLMQGKNVTETTYLCGFSNQSHLSNCFKKHSGVSPSDIIKSRKKL